MVYAVYEAYISHLVVVWYLGMPHIRYVCMLLPLIVLYVRHAHLGLPIWVRLEARTTRIWSFGFGFVFATAMGCSGLRLLFGLIIVF